MPQHMTALNLANKVRLERAQIRKDIRSGRLSIVGLLQDPPMEMDSALVFNSIMWMKGWGEDRTRTLFNQLGLSQWLTYGKITKRQTNLLIKEFEMRLNGA